MKHASCCESKQVTEPKDAKCLLNEMPHIGLLNLGNTCFMNSGLQCLCSSRPLVLSYFSRVHNAQSKSSRKGISKLSHETMTSCMQDLCLSYTENRLVSPSSVKRCVARYNPIFTGYSQHDSQELMMTVIDAIHTETNCITKMPPYVEVDTHGSIEEVHERFQANFNSRNVSPIADACYGCYCNRVTCKKCGDTFYNFEHSPFLTVPMPTRSDNIDILFDSGKKEEAITTQTIAESNYLDNMCPYNNELPFRRKTGGFIPISIDNSDNENNSSNEFNNISISSQKKEEGREASASNCSDDKFCGPDGINKHLEPTFNIAEANKKYKNMYIPGTCLKTQTTHLGKKQLIRYPTAARVYNCFAEAAGISANSFVFEHVRIKPGVGISISIIRPSDAFLLTSRGMYKSDERLIAAKIYKTNTANNIDSDNDTGLFRRSRVTYDGNFLPLYKFTSEDGVNFMKNLREYLSYTANNDGSVKESQLREFLPYANVNSDSKDFGVYGTAIAIFLYGNEEGPYSMLRTFAVAFDYQKILQAYISRIKKNFLEFTAISSDKSCIAPFPSESASTNLKLVIRDMLLEPTDGITMSFTGNELLKMTNNLNEGGAYEILKKIGDKQLEFNFVADISSNSNYLGDGSVTRIFLDFTAKVVVPGVQINSIVQLDAAPEQKSSDIMSLYDCMETHCRKVDLTGFSCDICKVKTQAVSEFSIWKLPPTLLIHFKRFSSTGAKNEMFIDYPTNTELDMTKFFAPESPYIKDPKQTRYVFCAASYHSGSCGGGHYTALARGLNKKFYSCNDSSCYEVNSISASRNAYVVVYEQKE